MSLAVNTIAGIRREVQEVQGGTRRARPDDGRPLIPSRLSMYHTPLSWMTSEDLHPPLLSMSYYVRHGGSLHTISYVQPFTLRVEFLSHLLCIVSPINGISLDLRVPTD